MPSSSKKQHDFMQAIAHGWHPTGKEGPLQAVAKEFVAADKKAGKYAQGGVVKKEESPAHEATESPSIEAAEHHGKWPYSKEQHGMYAQGGPVRHEGVDKFYKTPDRSHLGRFLSKQDRFTSGRLPAGYPGEMETEENWGKPKGVGHTDRDDIGDGKTRPPIKPQK
jgi:hypothetical protein